MYPDGPSTGTATRESPGAALPATQTHHLNGVRRRLRERAGTNPGLGSCRTRRLAGGGVRARLKRGFHIECDSAGCREDHVSPVPLGKSPLVATRVPRLWRGSGTVISLRSVEKAIPDPLPDPPPQPACRRIAQTLTVISRDGHRLVYGPCVFPDPIVHLERVMYRVALKGR